MSEREAGFDLASISGDVVLALQVAVGHGQTASSYATVVLGGVVLSGFICCLPWSGDGE